MEDVHAVMDAVGSERAVLVGVSEGGPMCSLFAATYPERTSGLVMIGTYAKRIRDEDYPWAPTEDQREAFFELMRREWGGPVGIDERAPSMADDPEFRAWLSVLGQTRICLMFEDSPGWWECRMPSPSISSLLGAGIIATFKAKIRKSC